MLNEKMFVRLLASLTKVQMNKCEEFKIFIGEKKVEKAKLK